ELPAPAVDEETSMSHQSAAEPEVGADSQEAEITAPPPAPPSEITEPRFPPLETPDTPLQEAHYSLEAGESSPKRLVTLGFSAGEEGETEMSVKNSAECNVPRLDTSNFIPE